MGAKNCFLHTNTAVVLCWRVCGQLCGHMLEDKPHPPFVFLIQWKLQLTDSSHPHLHFQDTPLSFLFSEFFVAVGTESVLTTGCVSGCLWFLALFDDGAVGVGVRWGGVGGVLFCLLSSHTTNNMTVTMISHTFNNIHRWCPTLCPWIDPYKHYSKVMGILSSIYLSIMPWWQWDQWSIIADVNSTHLSYRKSKFHMC